VLNGGYNHLSITVRLTLRDDCFDVMNLIAF
jgi:hypothetical protein